MLSLTAGILQIGGSPRPLFRMTAGSCYVLTYRAVCHGVSPGTRKDICIITAAVAAGMTEVNSFESTVSNEGGFTELRSDKAGAAICAPLCGTQHCFTGIKTVIHAPGFYEPAAQVLSNARSARSAQRSG